MLVLGLSGCFETPQQRFISGLPRWFGHDAAAALVEDGVVLAAIEEERLTRIKHTNDFPSRSAAGCLEYSGRTIEEVDAIAYFFEELDTDKELGLLYAEKPSIPLLYSRPLIAERLTDAFRRDVDPGKIRFVHHHTTHAYAAYFQSGFDDALIAILDGSGERESISLFTATGRKIEMFRHVPPSHSLGHLYSTCIELLAYSLFDEYKVMGLAPYGDPARYRQLFSSCYELCADGRYEMDYSRVRSRFLMAGFRPRRKGEPFTQTHKDVAAGLQETLETIATHVLKWAREHTGKKRLCLSGGVALNCSMNGRLLESGLFEKVFVHPASHDAGAAIGAAMYVCETESPHTFAAAELDHVFWGPAAGNASQIDSVLASWKAFLDVKPSHDITADTAKLLANDAVVGWVQGRSEFGPRALGNRSILADPRPASNKDRINELVKKREAYRPFAPSILEEQIDKYFEVPPSAPRLDFMVIVVRVRPQYRDLLGAITHVDGTARVQAVSRSTNERYWSLVNEFGRITGVPILLNTSFNNNAEPIVQTVEDAIECLLTTGVEHLVVDNFVVAKRSVAWTQYLELVPVLHPSVALRLTAGGCGGVADKEPHHEIYFNVTGGDRKTISSDVFWSLMKANGDLRVKELGLASERAVAELLFLWGRRFLRLRPCSRLPGPAHLP